MVARRPGPVRGALDAQAMAYAKLLSDPINAPLVHPVYAGGDGGYLMRFNTTLTMGKTPTGTASYLQWTPGAVGPNGVDLIVGTDTTSAGTPVATAIGGSAFSPGYLFLSSNASAFRTVAASMQVTYAG